MARRKPQDPTGQARNRQKGTATLGRRLTRAESQVKRLFRVIPRTRRRQVALVNDAHVTTIYDYELSDQEIAALAASITFILNRELLETQTGVMPFNWYWQDNVEMPYRQGTIEEINRFNQIVAAAVIAGVLVDLAPAAVSIESVLLSEPYRQALSNVFVSNFQSVKGLSERTSAQVMQQLNAGIQAGNTPTEIAEAITERFDVSRSSAKRIAATEINKAFNDAQMAAIDVMAEQTGLRAGVIHISALLPTTRATHGFRHGNVYTTADQLKWWNMGSNRINCHCSVISVLIDRFGKVVQKKLQDRVKAEGGQFFS